MKTRRWLSIAAVTSLVISAAFIIVCSTTHTPHGVTSVATGNSVFVPAVTEIQLISTATLRRPSQPASQSAYDALRPNP